MEGYNVIATGFYGRRLWIDIYYCPMFLAKYKFDENMNLNKNICKLIINFAGE